MHGAGPIAQLRLLLGQVLIYARPWQRALIGAALGAIGVALVVFGAVVAELLLTALGVLLIGRTAYGSLQRLRSGHAVAERLQEEAEEAEREAQRQQRRGSR